jgi:Icc-related predicted phosphoesterase
MKTLQEIKSEIEKAIESDQDAFVYAIHEKGSRTTVLSVLGNTDTIEEYMRLAQKEINRYVNIVGFEIEICKD